MAVLENDTIILRALEPGDVDLLYRWENDPENWFVSNTLTPFSREVIRRYVEESHKDIYEQKQLRLMIQLKAPPAERSLTVGAIDLFDFNPYHLRAGVGILIAEKGQRSRGLASDALRLLVDYAFGVLGLHQLYCNIAADNESSIRLFSKAGFIRTGEKKDWLRDPSGWVPELLFQKINSR
jgi:diamine N-acetyltransferase